MKVILHIGDAKCGSSAIQASLFAASERLLEHGILYHAPGQPTNGHFSYITLLNGKTRGDNAGQAELARQNIAETQALIAIHKPEYLLLSGESLFNVLPGQILDLCSEILSEPPEEVHVVAFLRHPVDLYLSFVQQTLKASHEFQAPNRYVRDTPATFRRWHNEPRCTSLNVRLMDRAQLAEGSVVAEFRDLMRGLVAQTNLTLEDNEANVSLSTEQTILLQHLRQDFMADQNNRFCAGSNRLVRFFETLNAEFGMVGTKAALTPEVAACILQKNLPYMRELDELFPTLGMVASREWRVVPWGEESRKWNGSVTAVLAEHDLAIVALFRRLIPEYNPALSRGEVEVALRSLSALGLRRRSYHTFANYMTWCKLPEAAEAVRAAF